MDIITWLLVGLIAGGLAGVLVRGSGFGVLGDIGLGIVGAIVGGAAFRELGWTAPFTGLVGVVSIALLGAVVVLVVARVLGGARTRA